MEKAPADINANVRCTLTIGQSEYKDVADLHLDLEEGLPAVVCHMGEINQVILNLIVNAAHAIADARGPREEARGRISVRTHRDGPDVLISVADTGTGIPDHFHAKLFDPFFTTKEVGRGTGQGLAIARGIAEKHGGELGFETEVGRGTTFTLRLPIEDCAARARAS